MDDDPDRCICYDRYIYRLSRDRTGCDVNHRNNLEPEQFKTGKIWSMSGKIFSDNNETEVINEISNRDYSL